MGYTQIENRQGFPIFAAFLWQNNGYQPAATGNPQYKSHEKLIAT